MTTKPNKNRDGTRREFIKKASVATTAAAVTPLVVPRNVHASEGDGYLRIGLVGCGGRGTSAVSNAINSSEQVKIVAMADVAPNKLIESRNSLQKQWEDNGGFEVNDDSCFIGHDSYKDLCSHPDVDIVIHTTPPGLRFLTLREAVENGKHSFVEKPVCVDAATYHHVIESGKIADRKGVAIVSGTQYRRETSYKAAMEQLHSGVIGDIVSAFAYYCSGPLWLRGTESDWEKWGGPEGMEFQMRNWLYFNWLSGDHIAEQAIHNLDAINWGLKSTPVSAYGSGGRLVRTGPNYGNIYDHFSIDYDYADNVRLSFHCRQMPGAKGRVTNRFIGTKGTMDIRPNPGRTATIVRDFDGKVVWNHNGRDNNAPYEQEHKELVASIRAEKPIQEIQEVADSSMTAIIGREAAYSGQEVTYKWAVEESKQSLAPKKIEFGKNSVRPVPMPGSYKLS